MFKHQADDPCAKKQQPIQINKRRIDVAQIIYFPKRTKRAKINNQSQIRKKEYQYDETEFKIACKKYKRKHPKQHKERYKRRHKRRQGRAANNKGYKITPHMRIVYHRFTITKTLLSGLATQ